MWSKLGFSIRDEKTGRAKNYKSKLKIWWKDLGNLDLFSLIPHKVFVAAIDMNVLIDIQASNSPESEESKALLSDWFTDTVELVITDEIYTEIDRVKNEQLKLERRQFASSFRTAAPILKTTNEDSLKILNSILGTPNSLREKSDRNHIVKSILGKANFFVTRDEELINHADIIDSKLGISVVRPCDIISQTNSELSCVSFSPSKLEGTNLKIRLLAANEIDEALLNFQNLGKSELKKSLLSILRYLFSNPITSKIQVIENDSDMLGLIASQKIDDNLHIPLLRIKPGPLHGVLARHLCWITVKESAQKRLKKTIFSDKYSSPSLIQFFLELGFSGEPPSLEKENMHGVIEPSEVIKTIRNSSFGLPSTAGYLYENSNRKEQKISASLVHSAEKILWPAIVKNSPLPCYSIPIQPQWAISLFHHELSKEMIFDSQPELMLRLDNAYYRSANPKILQAPARILWYVAHGDIPSTWTSAYVATSHLNEVSIGTAKDLFSRFRRYGTFNWDDVNKVSNGVPNKKIMAFLFSHTTCFKQPVSLKQAKAINLECNSKNLILQSPFKVTQNFYERITSEGLKQ